MSEVTEAKARVLAAFDAMRAYHDDWFGTDPNDDLYEPFTLDHIYETRPGSGAVMWDLDLADVLLIAQADA